MRDTHTHTETETQAWEKQAPCREPDVGLDPGSPGSRPGLQVMLRHGGCPGARGIFISLSVTLLELDLTLDSYFRAKYI